MHGERFFRSLLKHIPLRPMARHATVHTYRPISYFPPFPLLLDLTLMSDTVSSIFSSQERKTILAFHTNSLSSRYPFAHPPQTASQRDIFDLWFLHLSSKEKRGFEDDVDVALRAASSGVSAGQLSDQSQQESSPQNAVESDARYAESLQRKHSGQGKV